MRFAQPVFVVYDFAFIIVLFSFLCQTPTPIKVRKGITPLDHTNSI